MRRFLLLTLLAVIAFSPVIFMKKSKTEISEEGYIGKSEIVIKDGKMTPEALLAFGRMSDPQVSPDGKHIMYGVSYTSTKDNRSVRNLYICNIDGSGNQQITRSGKSISNARWNNDGSGIFFLTKGQMWSAALKHKNGEWELDHVEQLTDIPNGISAYHSSHINSGTADKSSTIK